MSQNGSGRRSTARFLWERIGQGGLNIIRNKDLPFGSCTLFSQSLTEEAVLIANSIVRGVEFW